MALQAPVSQRTRSESNSHLLNTLMDEMTAERSVNDWIVENGRSDNVCATIPSASAYAGRPRTEHEDQSEGGINDL
jgi:hypothetical protein